MTYGPREIKPCPVCDRPRPSFTIAVTGCDICRKESARETEQATGLSWNDIRTKRNRLLTKTDFMENPSWRQLQTAADLAAIDSWRQSLRDIPQSFASPEAVNFTPPPHLERFL